MGLAQQVRRGKADRLEHEYRVSVANCQPHRKIAKGEQALDVRLESPLGRLNFQAVISEDQYEVGKRYREIVGAYMATIEAPADLPPSLEKCALIRDNYNAWFEALMRVGHRPTKMVSRVVIYDEEPVDEYSIECLKIGLSALVRHQRAMQRDRTVISFSNFQPVVL